MSDGARRAHIDWRRDAALSSVLLVLVLLPLAPFSDDHILGILVRAFLFIALGQTWNLIAGFGGQLSLGHGIFFGFGAYTTAFVFNLLGISPWIGAWAGVALSVAVAAILAAVTMRLRGVYFALATVVASLAFERLARYYVDVTGGDSGLAVRFVGDSGWAAQSRHPLPFFWAGLTLVVALYIFSRLLGRTRFGMRLRAVRDDEEAARSAGVDPFMTKTLGLMLSGGLTALVGAVYVQAYLAIDPATAFGLFQAIQIQLPALIGGLGTPGGPVIGGFVMIIISELSNSASTRFDIQGLDILVYGLVLLGIVRWAPNGLLGRALRAAGRKA
ncbi:MAG: branched-chain amino acid ABC transporter permease [Acetobacteraceae bacterium]|nr:branched-chain amino acid ABC transporter permease [Acetobacteraceae bacterium]